MQYFPSSLSTFSPATARVCRIPLTSGTSFIDPETIKIAFRVRNTDATNQLAPATPNPACFIQRVQVFANGQRCDDINYYGRTVAAHDLLKGREYNRTKAMEGFDKVNAPRCPCGAPKRVRGRADAPHHGGHPALRQDAAASAEPGARDRVRGRHDCAVVQERRGAPGGSHAEPTSRSRTSESWPPRSSWTRRWSSPSTGRSSQEGPSCSATPRCGVAEHNVTVARAFTKLMGAFVTFWDNDAGSKIHLLANAGRGPHRRGQAGGQPPGVSDAAGQPAVGASEHFHFLSILAGTYDDTVRNINIGRVGYLRHSFIAGFPTERVPKMPLSGVSTRSGDLAWFTFKALDGTMTASLCSTNSRQRRGLPRVTPDLSRVKEFGLNYSTALAAGIGPGAE